MAKRNPSALKAHRQNVVRREHNRALRSKLRTGLKAVRAALDGGKVDDAKALLAADRVAGRSDGRQGHHPPQHRQPLQVAADRPAQGHHRLIARPAPSAPPRAARAPRRTARPPGIPARGADRRATTSAPGRRRAPPTTPAGPARRAAAAPPPARICPRIIGPATPPSTSVSTSRTAAAASPRLTHVDEREHAGRLVERDHQVADVGGGDRRLARRVEHQLVDLAANPRQVDERWPRGSGDSSRRSRAALSPPPARSASRRGRGAWPASGSGRRRF